MENGEWKAERPPRTGRLFVLIFFILHFPFSILHSQFSWPRHTIDPPSKSEGKAGADGVRLGDANHDGLPDVVTGWENGDAIRVCVNPGPARARLPWPGVTVGRVAGAEDAVFADLDGDGALDVVTCTEGKTKSIFFHWAPAQEKYMDAEAWETVAVPAAAGKALWMFALPLDVDGKHGIDLIVGSKGDAGGVGWLASPKDPRDAAAWRYHQLHRAAWIMSLRAADMDADGDDDILYSDRKGADSGVFWLENPGTRAPIIAGDWTRHLLNHAGQEVMFLDLHPDEEPGVASVAVAISGGPVCIGRDTRIPLPENAGTGKAVRWGSLGGSPEIDLVLTCENANGVKSGVWWYALGPEPGWHDIGGPEGVKFDRIELLDIDADGDLDVMTCEERDQLGVIWYENPRQ